MPTDTTRVARLRASAGLTRAALSAGIGLALLACSAAGSTTTGTPPPAPYTNGNPDAGEFTFPADAGGADAAQGALLAPCTPGAAGSCTTGFTCYAQHTSPAWWVDLYGKCTFACTDQTVDLCASLDGICGCPVPAGASADSGACSELDGGTPLTCVPAVKPGM